MLTQYKNIIVAGQGAMGLLWYHHIAQTLNQNNFNKVTLLSSKQSLVAEEQERNSTYEFCAYQEQQGYAYPLIYSSEQDISHADVLMLCLKSVHIVDTIKKVAKKIKPHCLLILAHNGLGVFESIEKFLVPQQVVMTLLTTHGCLRHTPLVIEHTGKGSSDIGLLTGNLTPRLINGLINQLQVALPTVTYHEKIIEKQWLKLAVNCVINPITAINDVDNGELCNKQYDTQITKLLTEIVQVSHSQGVIFKLQDLQQTIQQVALATAKNCSSMRSDVLAGNTTEVDNINGYIHYLGQTHQIATPENSRLWQQVRSLTDVTTKK